MSSDLEVIKAIVDAFERSDWAEIDVRSGSLRVHLSTQAQTIAHSASASPAEVLAAAPTTAGDPAPDTLASAADVEPGNGAAIPDGAHVVVSPSPGIFWRSPLPNAPPFADLGHVVEPGSTLCIVEVMKLMNHISSEVGGTVVGVFAKNGVRVDRGDALFAVQPSASR